MPDSSHSKSRVVQNLVNQLRQMPQDAAGWQALGDQLAESGNHRQAALCYEKALSLKPGPDQAAVLEEALQQEKNSETESTAVQVDLKPLLGFQLPLWFQVFLALYSFVVTLFLALANQWQPTELVWGFWISSLVTGFAMLFTSLAGSFFNGQDQPQTLGTQMLTSFPLLRVAGAIFLLAFFTVHFGFFHFIIGTFLQLFFPLVNQSNPMDNPFLSMGDVFFTAVRRFWVIIGLSCLTQIRSFRYAWYLPLGKAMGMPYANVVRMHLSIFAFAFLSFAASPQMLIFVVLFFYFFPWGQVLGFLAKGRKQALTPGGE